MSGSEGPIRLVVSDVDGTLVRNDKSLSEGNIAAARRLIEAGIDLSLISARPPSGILWIAERLGLRCPIGAFNGGTIVSPAGEIVSAIRLSPDAARKALALLDRPGVTPWLFANGNWYGVDRENPHVPRERLSAGVDGIFDADWTTLLESVDKIVGVSDDHDRLGDLEAEMAEALNGAATVARSQPYYLDITAIGADKGHGLAALAETYAVPLEAVAVLGDQRNDLPMFARAGLSIAMGQAPDAVQAAATEVARSNEEDGFADGITRFILPRVASHG